MSDYEELIRALRGSQWVRSNPGSLYQCGANDKWWGRDPFPHYGRFLESYAIVNDHASIAEYLEGYNFGDPPVFKMKTIEVRA